MGEPEPVGAILTRWCPVGGSLPAMNNDQPHIWVQVQVVMPRELGGHIVTKQLHLPSDEEIPGYGAGAVAMVDKAADDAVDDIRRLTSGGH